MLDETFFARPASAVAPDLLGMRLTLEGVGGIVVETEAYESDDPASHSFGGAKTRNRTMFGPAGRAYVYRSYGIHWCLNVVCRTGDAVLIRALEPTARLDAMRARRGLEAERLLCSGPGRLCQALGVSAIHDGLAVDAQPFGLEPRRGTVTIAAGPRIGISKGLETPWRFAVPGSRFTSRRD